MKPWLAGAVLLVLFALALSLLRRESPPDAGPEPAADLPPGWGSVVLGAPSDALQPPVSAAPAPAPAPVPVAQELELVVEPGQSLSAICRAHYGGASVARVEALARYNGLPSPDAVRAGQTLKLPPLATLEKP